MTLLKRHRLAKGLTLRQLGKLVGATAASVHGWETGKCVPSAEKFPKLARVFEIEPMEITRLVSPDKPAVAA